MIASKLRTTPRSLAEIASLIEAYPPDWRRWCDGPEQQLGCACRGCVRHPAPATVPGRDPEACEWPDEADALTAEEVRIYFAGLRGPWGFL